LADATLRSTKRVQKRLVAEVFAQAVAAVVPAVAEDAAANDSRTKTIAKPRASLANPAGSFSSHSFRAGSFA
jgi:hypothetical protein